MVQAKPSSLRPLRNLRCKEKLREKLEADVYKNRYASFLEIKMSEGTRRQDQELINILERGKTLDGFPILKELAIDPVRPKQ